VLVLHTKINFNFESFFVSRNATAWPKARYKMPSTLLFSVNNEGRAYALSTGNSAWREFLYLGLEFKKLSAVPHFIWAIGSDRQVYVHVHSLDVPIRICETSYENERWYPPSGWSQSLLPTDRPRFSSEDGLIDRNIESVRLPSMAWQVKFNSI
jgi:tectonin beta-propeller repeat-containing protein 1